MDPLDHLAELIASAPMNLVSASERSRVREVHIEESLAVGGALGLRAGDRLLDLGTGGGLPGLVLAIRHPETTWLLVDSVRKKALAAERFASALKLENVDVRWGRAEALAREPGLRESFDGVVARAVAPLVVLAELARGFVGDGGWLGAVKGPGWEAEVAAASWACAQLGWSDVHSNRIASTARPTWLVTMRAAGTVPEACPRAVGVPQRRPLVAPEAHKP